MNFTDQEIINFSKEIAEAEQNKALLNQNKGTINTEKQKKYDEDQNNKKFFDLWFNSVCSYHSELRYLEGKKYTNYEGEAELHKSALKAEGNLHYPVPPASIWRGLCPKLLPSNNGLPVSNDYASDKESIVIGLIQEAYDIILNGFSDGSTSTTLTSSYSSGNQIYVYSTSGFEPNDRVVISGGGKSMLARVVSIASSGACSIPSFTTPATCIAGGGTWEYTYSLVIEVICPSSGTLPMGSTVRNYHAAFTNYERENYNSSDVPEVLNYLKLLLYTRVITWNNFLLNINNIVSDNKDLRPNNKQHAIYLSGIRSELTRWVNMLAEGVNGRYSDGEIQLIDNLVKSRTKNITERIAEIKSLLGSVSQPDYNSYNGDGAYNNQFKWIEMRISLAGGSLSGYYNVDVGSTVMNTKEKMMDGKLADILPFFVVVKVENDADGTTELLTSDGSSLFIGDEVKIVSNNMPLLTRSVVNKDSNKIILNDTVSPDYKIDYTLRVVKLL